MTRDSSLSENALRRLRFRSRWITTEIGTDTFSSTLDPSLNSTLRARPNTSRLL